MGNKRIFLGLDVGTKRVGVAVGDSIARISQPVTTLDVDNTVAAVIQSYVADYGVTDVVVGRPRNQSGDVTSQTTLVEGFVSRYLEPIRLPLHWQDESVTSVIAEERLKSRKKAYTKSDIDAEAAAIILQDYLETL